MPVRLSSTQGLVGRPLSSRPKDQMATTHPTASERLAKPALPVSPWRTEASRPGAGRRRPGETMRRKPCLHPADDAVVEARLLLRPMVPGVIRAKRVEAAVTGVQDGGSTPPTSMISSGRAMRGHVDGAAGGRNVLNPVEAVAARRSILSRRPDRPSGRAAPRVMARAVSGWLPRGSSLSGDAPHP